MAEPVCRPDNVHEYVLTPHSLYAAVSVGLETDAIIAVLDRLSKVKLAEQLKRFVRTCTRNYGKVWGLLCSMVGWWGGGCCSCVVMGGGVCFGCGIWSWVWKVCAWILMVLCDSDGFV